jgi:cytoskeletal protein CcmA (bactofilin family)
MTNSDDDTTIFTSLDRIQIRDGDVTVGPGSSQEIGTIQNGDLTIEPGGRAELTGILNGDVRNRGGYLHVVGIVNGNVFNTGGQVEIDPAATIKGDVIEE